MSSLSQLNPARVFYYFEQLTRIPRGSGNIAAVADYCMAFAETHRLAALRDIHNNVVIYKPAAAGYETAAPLILQGHLDMVCQKTADSTVNLDTDPITAYVDGDFIHAKDTTLGADNGIAVAMILAILEDSTLPHPPLEAVFTADEEIGMVGASAMDTGILRGKRMINLDSEDGDTVTVSCAGGSDFAADIPLARTQKNGTAVTVTLYGLRGGHSGVCIHEGRVNASLLAARLLNTVKKQTDVALVHFAGGDKGNAIPCAATFTVCTVNPAACKETLLHAFAVIKSELAAREPDVDMTVTVGDTAQMAVITDTDASLLIHTVLCAPNGVMDMSAEIDGLVETSLNLGILSTEPDRAHCLFALRSNKKTALAALEEKLTAYFTHTRAAITTGGHYPPWEYRNRSSLRDVYVDAYTALHGTAPKVEAIHAGLECAVFADKIGGFDGIAIGPQMFDVHTVNERLSVSSTAEIYKVLLKTLANCR